MKNRKFLFKPKFFLLLVLVLVGTVPSLISMPVKSLFSETKPGFPSRIGLDMRTTDLRDDTTRSNATVSNDTPQLARAVTVLVSENDDTPEPATTSDSVDSIDSLTQKITDASEAVTAWDQEGELIIATQDETPNGTKQLIAEAQEAALYWRDESERYSLARNTAETGLQNQLSNVLEACNRAAAAAEEAQRFGENLTAIAQGVHHLTQKEDPTSITRYADAETLWRQRQSVWDGQSNSYGELQESRKKLTISKQRIEEAKKATTDEELQKTRLGKIARYAGITGSAVGSIPISSVQAAGVVVSTVGEIADVINRVWAASTLAAEEALHQVLIGINQDIETTLNQVCGDLLRIENEAQKKEGDTLNQERNIALHLALLLKPQATWKEAEWGAWSNLVGTEMNWASTQSSIIAEVAQKNAAWVEKITAHAWKDRIKRTKQKVEQQTKQRTEDLAVLYQHYDTARQEVDRMSEQLQQSQAELQSQQDKKEQFKEKIEQLAEEMSRFEGDDQIIFGEKRNKFLEALTELQKIYNDTSKQTAWEEAVANEAKARGILWTRSAAYSIFEKPILRRLQRTKATLEANQEALWRHWPDYDNDLTCRPYLRWNLPEEIEEPFSAMDAHEEDHKIPLQLEAELAARGYRYLEEQEESINQALNPFSSTSVLNAIPPIERSVNQSSSSVNSTLLNPTQELIKWNLDQFDLHWRMGKNNNSSIAEQNPDEKRWNARKELLRLRKKYDQLIKVLAANYIENHSSGANEAGSTRTPSILGYFMGSNSTIAPSRTPTAILRASPLNNLARDLQQTDLEKAQALELWTSYLNDAESIRVARTSEPLDEKKKLDAWASADDTAIEEEYRRTRVLKEKVKAREMEGNWEKENERWRSRAAADAAQFELEKLQQQGPLPHSVTESERIQQEEERRDQLVEAIKKVTDSESIWTQFARQHRDLSGIGEENRDAMERALTSLKIFDKRVNDCWAKFKDRHEGLLENEASQNEQGEALSENEQHRLDGIEQLWERIFQHQKKEDFKQAEEAASAFHQKNQDFLWNQLSLQQRQAYNNWIALKNNSYNEMRGPTEAFLKDIHHQIKTEKERLKNWLSWAEDVLTGRQIAVMEFLSKVEDYYNQESEKSNRHREALKLAKMSVEARKIEDTTQLAKQKIEGATQLAKQKIEQIASIVSKAQAEGDKEKEVLQKKILNILRGSRWSPGIVEFYNKAANAQEHKQYELVQIYCMVAESLKLQAEAVDQGNQDKAKLFQQTVEVLINDWNQGAVFCYQQAAKEQLKGNNQAAQAYSRSAEALILKAKLISINNQTAATRQTNIASAQKHAATAYSLAAEEAGKDSNKAAQAYVTSAQAYEKQADAFHQLDQKGEKYFNTIAETLSTIALNHRLAEEEKNLGNNKASQAFLKCAEYNQEALEAWEKNKKTTASLRNASSIYAEAATMYKNANVRYLNRGAVQAYLKSGEMHEQQATAILQEDQENVELYSKIATVWRLAAKAHIGAANTYFWETFIQSWTDPLKNIYLKQAITYEQEAEAIAKKDHITAATLATLAHDLQLNINKRIEEMTQREQNYNSNHTDIGLGGA